MFCTLGIIWNQRQDVLTYNYTPTKDHLTPTKRSVSFKIGQLFDPLGWLAPVIVTAKIIMQSLWTSGINWDEPLPSDILIEWQEYTIERQDLSKIIVPRVGFPVIDY